jgi:hypothetical protein
MTDANAAGASDEVIWFSVTDVDSASTTLTNQGMFIAQKQFRGRFS